jgi:hypothetical protein
MREGGNPVVMSPPIREEWNRHVSRFTKTWLASMVARRLLVRVPGDEDRELRAQLEACVARSGGDDAAREGVNRAMQKDAHLIEAASRSDRCVAATDDRVRGHFSECSGIAVALAEVQWVNPANEEENAISWVRSGAKSDTRRELRLWRHRKGGN